MGALRNNAGAITVNLVRLAIKNKLNPEGFYKELERVMELCKENSIFRMNYLKDTKASSAPILWQSGALAELQPNETVGQFLFNGYTTISIGFIGLSEVSQLLFGTDFSQDDKIYKECIKIMEFMKSKVDEYKKETGIGFALYGTPLI